MKAKEATALAQELLDALRYETVHTGSDARTCEACALIRRAKKLLKK